MQDFPSETDQMFHEEETHLSEYLMVLLKRRTLILLVVILTFSGAVFYIYSSDPVYQSSARLIIDKESSSSPITGERMESESFHSQSLTFNTSIAMIKSSGFLMQVISALNLDAEISSQNDQDLEISFIKELMHQFKSNIRLLLQISDTKGDTTIEQRQNRWIQGLIAAVRSKISVTQVNNTRLLNISVKDKNPEMAARMANTVAKKYMEFELTTKVQSSKEKLAWLNNELYELKEKLEEDELKFFEYKQQFKVFSIAGKQKLAEQKIQEFNSNYLETRNRRLELDAKISELNKNIKGVKSVANVRSLISNPMIDTIYSRILDLEIELTRLSKVFKSKHPKIIQTKSELDKSRKRLGNEIARERENLRSERKVLYAREKTLEKTIGEFENEALNSSSKELKYTILERNVNTSKNLYDLMVSRLKESNILQSSNTSSNMRLVESALVPTTPISPNKKRALLMGAVLGIFLGTGLAFLFEYLDQTIKTEEDIRGKFDLQVLAVVPKADKTIAYGADN